MISVLVVNSLLQTVQEDKIDPSMENIKKLIGCDMVDCVRVDQDHIMYVDDFGLVRKDVKTGFSLDRFELGKKLIKGNAVIMGYCPRGTDVDASSTVPNMCSRIEWLGDFDLNYVMENK